MCCIIAIVSSWDVPNARVSNVPKYSPFHRKLGLVVVIPVMQKTRFEVPFFALLSLVVYYKTFAHA